MPKSRPKTRRNKKTLSSAQKGKYRLHGLIDFGSGQGQEKKFYDRYSKLVDSVSDIAVLIQPVLSLPQGDGASARDGQKIWINSITMKLTMETPTHGSSFPNPPVTRWDYRLFVDKQSNGAVPANTDLQQPLGAGGSCTRPDEGLSMYVPNMANSSRFVTLKSGHANTTVTYDDGASSANQSRGTASCYYKFPGKGLMIDITNVDGSIGGFKSNNLYLFIQNNGPAGDQWTLATTTRIRYTDG